MQDHQPIDTNALDTLISSNNSAKEYFMALPDYVQGMLRQRSDQIETIDDLYEKAQNMNF